MEIQISDKDIPLGSVQYSNVLFGTYKGKQVAVKRVEIGQATDIEEALNQLDHPNIVKLLYVESDKSFRYYAFELCVASLNEIFLDPDHPRKYKGPELPNRLEVFSQLATGLEYIHSNYLIHGDIKPGNVLISVDSTGQITLKWADFGLSRSENERGTYTMSSEIVETNNWMALELLESIQNDETPGGGTIKSDVFSLGLVFAYLLLNGKHLYGEECEIVENMLDNNPVNMKEIKESPFNNLAVELIKQMLAVDPDERISTSDVLEQLDKIKRIELPSDLMATLEYIDNTIERLTELKKTYIEQQTTRAEYIQLMAEMKRQDKKPTDDAAEVFTVKDEELTKQITETEQWKMTFDSRNIIGSGSCGHVFRGLWNGKQVAVKRIHLTDYSTPFETKEEKILCQLNHPNVIKLLQVVQDNSFRFYILELAAGSLNDFCQGYYKGPMPSDGEALKQMTNGLHYIHGKNFVHRNIKPSNILISKQQPARLMIADFSLCEAVTTDSDTRSIRSEMKETDSWIALEICDDDNNEQPVQKFVFESDTWALGCVFFYFLTRGIHPFGKNVQTIRWNIAVLRKPIELEKTLQTSNHEMTEVYKLIRDMINVEIGKRIQLGIVITKLKTLYPQTATSSYKTAEKDPTDQGNEELTPHPSTSKEIDTGIENENIIDTTASGETKADVDGKTSGANDEDDNSNRSKIKEDKKDCCPCCKNEIASLKSAYKELKKGLGNAQEKIGHLNESAIRTNLDANQTGKTRDISSLYQLVKCYGEAKDEEWTEMDTHNNCKLVVKHLRNEKSERAFCEWYYNEAKMYKDLAPGLREQIGMIPFLNEKGKINYSVVKKYRDSKILTNFISGSIKNWDEFSEPSGPIFLLALFESVQGKTDLLSFPPPGRLTMDVPVKISSAKSSVHIEVGEIKSSDDEKVIRNAKLQLRRSLLCFKWLDQVITQVKASYGLIGYIYINGNCSATQKKRGIRSKSEYLSDEEIIIKHKYKTYK